MWKLFRLSSFLSCLIHETSTDNDVTFSYTIDFTQLSDISVSLDSSHAVVRHDYFFLTSKMISFRSAHNQKLRVEGPSGRSPSS